MTTALAQNLKKRRLELKISTHDVQRRSNGKISASYVQQLERGVIAAPSIIMIAYLLRLYNLKPELIFSWINAPVVETKTCDKCGQPLDTIETDR